MNELFERIKERLVVSPGYLLAREWAQDVVVDDVRSSPVWTLDVVVASGLD